jgi:hypothetical protein
MIFTESMSAHAFDTSVLTFQRRENQSLTDTSQFSLTGGVVTSSDSTDITIAFDHADTYGIYSVVGIFPTASECFVRFTSLFGADMVGNRIQSILPSSALQAESVYPDTEKPYITSFNFNFDSFEVEFLFSENVLSSTVDTTKMFLHSSVHKIDSVNLGSSDILSSDGLAVKCRLTREIMDRIKTIDILAQDSSSTFLSHSAGAFRDIFNHSSNILDDPL